MTMNPVRIRGVSLVEALIALAVMAFGMLSLVGVQATMRLNNDLSKQRTEATRIATEMIECLRGYAVMAVTPGQLSWDGLADPAFCAYVPSTVVNSASYAVVRAVSPMAGAAQKVVSIQVGWTDRTGTAQTVTLDTVFFGVAPALTSLLSVPAQPSPTNQVNGRNITIPSDAVDQGNGTSLFTPPGASNVAWYFNNLTGLICVGGATCTTPATLVSGTVSFDLRASPSSEAPAGPALNLASGPGAMALVSPIFGTAQCYADSYNPTQLGARSAVKYTCAVTPTRVAGWGGQLNPEPVDAANNLVAIGTAANEYKVCRYTPASTDFTANANHPKTYCLVASNTPATCPSTGVKTNLIHQNFLVILGDRSCPTDDSGTQLVNGNTLQHQP